MTAEPGRKTLRLLVRPLAVGVVAGVILALLAPYETAAIFRTVERYIFWIWCSVAGTLLLSTCDEVASALGREHGLPRPISVMAGILIAAVPITLIVYATAPAINDGVTLLPFWSLFPSVLILCIPLQTILLLLGRAPSAEAAPPEGPTVPVMRSPLFEKLPPGLGRDLLCMRTEDHYLRVYTARGEALILMRMSDAEASLGSSVGRRVHRSWWVARAAVRSAVVEDKAARLLLINGLTVPVSRSRLQSLRDQGWLENPARVQS